MEAVRINKCPVCGGISQMIYAMTQANKEEGSWTHCSCGVVFENEVHSKSDYSEKEVKDLNEAKEIGNRYFHYVKIYFPLIEELTVGRTMLNYKDKSDLIGSYCSARGWYVKSELSDKTKYDLIWLCNVLNEEPKPVEFLKSMADSLSDTGVIFVSDPNTDFIHTLGPMQWGNWSCTHSYTYFNPRSMAKQVERLNLDIVLNRPNYQHRFVYQNDFHLIAQKKLI